MSAIERLNAKLAEYEQVFKLNQCSYLYWIHEKTQLPTIHIALGMTAVAVFLTVGLFGLQFFSNLLAFIPIYASFKALRSPGKNDDVKWLTYWCTFGTFALIESLLDSAFAWLPLFFVGKMVFLVWCFAPSTEGALVVYERVLNPLFENIQRRVEAFSGEFSQIQNKSNKSQAALNSNNLRKVQ